MEMSKCLYLNSCLLQQVTNKYNLTEKPLNTQLHPASYYNPHTQAHTFSLAQYFQMVSAHIRALHWDQTTHPLKRNGKISSSI